MIPEAQVSRGCADIVIRAPTKSAMLDKSWIEACSEIGAAVSDAFVRLWKQDLVQVGLAIGMFLALALPLLVVILLLWYVDSTGWRPAGGFYKIGARGWDPMLDAHALAAGCGLWPFRFSDRASRAGATVDRGRAV